MTVQELIDKLMKVEDKLKRVLLEDMVGFVSKYTFEVEDCDDGLVIILKQLVSRKWNER